MIAFLAISAILNIALGYALAIYLGHARSAASPAVAPQPEAAPQPKPPTALPVAESHRVQEQPSVTQMLEEKGWADAIPAVEVTRTPIAQAETLVNELDMAENATPTLDATGTPTTLATTAEEAIRNAEAALSIADMVGDDEPGDVESPAPTKEVERELLAGIEDFRNQLAQMRGEPVTAPAVKNPAGASG